VRGKRRFTISELSEEFLQTSRTTLYQIVTDRLCYHKFCARWVPKQLTKFHKTQIMGSALTFLQTYWDEGEEFLYRIVTGDETWVQFVNAETKEQSKQWMHTHSPNKPKKFKQTPSNKKKWWLQYSGNVREFCWQNSWHRGHKNVRGLLLNAE